MNDHAHHICKDRELGIRDILARCCFDPATETVSLVDSIGRIAAEPCKALWSLPNALTSSMDAVAVRFADFEAGPPDTSGWVRGRDFDFCNTGIGMPEGFDTAVVVEDVRYADGKLDILQTPERRGANTVAPGSSMNEGEVLVERGWVVTPALAALLAQGGHVDVPVMKKPVVGFIPSGNELVAPGCDLPRGKSVECNSIMFAANVKTWGGEPLVHGICRDDWQEVRGAIAEMLETVDILVVNAGSSKGTDDLMMEILEDMGEVLNHEFSQGPGRHCSYSFVAGKPVVGIAGPPIGAEFCFEWYLKPVIDAYFGYGYERGPVLWARATQDMVMPPRDVDVVRRVSLYSSQGDYYAVPLSNAIKPVLKMCAMADGYVTVPKDSCGFERGAFVPVELKYPYRLPS